METHKIVELIMTKVATCYECHWQDMLAIDGHNEPLSAAIGIMSKYMDMGTVMDMVGLGYTKVQYHEMYVRYVLSRTTQYKYAEHLVYQEYLINTIIDKAIAA